MSDTDKKKTEIIVLHSVPSHQALMKSNRWRLRGVVLLMAVIVVTGFWLMPSGSFLDRYQKITAAQVSDIESNQGLSAEVDTLKGQLVGLVSGSIESKLRSLEASLRTGAINNSLGTIEDLKNDIRVLRSYSEPVKKQPSVSIANEQLIAEMAHLKRLIYLTIASCGLIVAGIAGIWIKKLNKLPYKEIINRYLGKH